MCVCACVRVCEPSSYEWACCCEYGGVHRTRYLIAPSWRALPSIFVQPPSTALTRAKRWSTSWRSFSPWVTLCLGRPSPALRLSISPSSTTRRARLARIVLVFCDDSTVHGAWVVLGGVGGRVAFFTSDCVHVFLHCSSTRLPWRAVASLWAGGQDHVAAVLGRACRGAR